LRRCLIAGKKQIPVDALPAIKGGVRVQFRIKSTSQLPMDLTYWLPGLFVFGIVLMGGCFLFVDACEKI
jgi:hypothetical protein